MITHSKTKHTPKGVTSRIQVRCTACVLAAKISPLRTHSANHDQDLDIFGHTAACSSEVSRSDFILLTNIMPCFRALSLVPVAFALIVECQAGDPSSLDENTSLMPLPVQASRLVARARDAGSLHLVDSTGLSPNVGVLQVRTSSGQYGSVCGMNLAAADVVCRQLGYDFGSVGSACGSYGGSSLCGDAGVPIAMKDLTCEGGEMKVQDCSYAPPDSTCSDHSLDSVVYCGTTGKSGNIEDGTLRIMSHDGSPSIDGEGRLEMFKAGSWAPICSITAGAEMVACKSMGFAGVKSSSVPDCLLNIIN